MNNLPKDIKGDEEYVINKGRITDILKGRFPYKKES